MNNPDRAATTISYTPEEKLQKAHLLDVYIATYMGSIYLAALGMYPQFSLLQSTEIRFVNDFDRFVGGVNENGLPMVVISSNQEIVTPRLKSRILKRFDLPSSLDNAPADFFKFFVFAHELGHVVQADPQFQFVFGEIDKTIYSPEGDYVRYVESDHEVNADYIAATIIATSEVGKKANYNPPNYPPMQWRDWAREHRVID